MRECVIKFANPSKKNFRAITVCETRERHQVAEQNNPIELAEKKQSTTEKEEARRIKRHGSVSRQD